MAVLELDFMEYATDGASQAAYVSSDLSGSDIIDSYSEANFNDWRDMQSAGYQQVGQALTFATEETISNCKFYLKKSLGSPTGNAYAKIYAATGTVGTNAVPTGSVLATSNAFDVSTLTTSFALILLTFSTPYVASAGDYCILLEYTGGDISNKVAFGIDSTSPTHDGNVFYTTTAGSGWTSNSALDSIFYLLGGDPVLQCYSEDTIKSQGSYSLKVVAAQTDSLNDTLTKSGLSIDLTDINELKLDVRADRTGSNLQARLYDDVGGWITKDINITSADEFQEFIWDISGVSNANKANISKIEFKILNADATTIYYIDNFGEVEATLELYDINNDFRNAILVLKDINNKFNSLPYATEGLYEYFEYATDEIAQSNYVSSDTDIESVSWDLLNEPCNDFTTVVTWTDNDGGTGASVIDPAGQFKFTAPGIGGGNAAQRYTDIGGYPATFTFEIKTYFTTLGTHGNNDHFDIFCEDGTNRFLVFFATDGLFINDGITDNEVGTNLVQTGVWQTWRFLVTSGATCDVYLNGALKASGVDCSDAATLADGVTYLTLPGFTVASEAHIDWIKIATGLHSPIPNLQCYSESTIIQQDSYSLKVVAKQTYSLNDTLTKSGLFSDLSNKDTLKLWVRSNRTGTNLQARIQDLGGTWSTKDINITQVGVFQEITWDISGVSNANKDYIDKIEFKILNADLDTIYYIDNLSSEILELININNDFRNAILELEDVSNDFRFLLEIIENINNKFNTALEVKKDVSNDFRNAIKTLKNISNDIRTGKETITDVSNDFRTVIETLLNLNNKFNMSLEVKKDIINNFRSVIGTLADITNDFRLRKLELENVSNDFRMVIGGLFGITNDFRSAIEVITDINNKFRTLKLIVEDLDNKFNFALRVLGDVNVKFAFALGALIDFNNDVRTHKLVIYNVNNNFRMIRSYQVPVPPEVGIQALGRSYFTVKINGVDKTSILDLDSLSWKETLNSSNTASFILGVPYDSVSCPIENQTVEILFNNHRKFYGYITNITKVSDPEGIQVSAEDEYWNLNKTEVDFKVGRTIAGDPDTYYTTIESALSALGFNVGIGNFIPVTMDLVGSKADVISQLVQESGNFQWFIKPDGTKKLWQADKGDIVNLEKQVIGTNLGLYQAINHNIVKDSSGIVNKFKVIMGDDIVPGYNNEFRFAYISQNYQQKSPEYMEAFHDGEPYSESQRRHFSSIQWYDKRRNTDTNAYEAIINIPLIGDGFRITVPSGMIKGYPLKYKSVYDIGVSWEIDVLSENTKVSYSIPYWYDRGGIYPECRRDRTFEVTLGTYPQTIVKDLVLSNLNVQYGTNYKVWEGHNWSYSREYERSELPPLPEPAKYIVNRTGAYITQKSFKISSWNDVAYATDYANWQLSKNCDIKEKGTIAITMDCAYFYGLDLSKRINISGITSEALNIVSISYDVRNYQVTINVESAREYKRSVSVPVHIREE